MTWFLMQYAAALGEHSLKTLKGKAILTGGKYEGSTVVNDAYPFDNLYMDNGKKVTSM